MSYKALENGTILENIKFKVSIPHMKVSFEAICINRTGSIEMGDQKNTVKMLEDGRLITVEDLWFDTEKTRRNILYCMEDVEKEYKVVSFCRTLAIAKSYIASNRSNNLFLIEPLHGRFVVRCKGVATS